MDMKLSLLLLGALAVLLLGGQWLLSNQFSAKIADLGRRLAAAQAAAPGEAVPGIPQKIPEAIRAFALRNGGRVGGPTLTVMTQKVEMRLAPDQPFFPLTARQLSGTRGPGFVWHATGRMAGILPLAVVDSFVADAGLLEARLFSAITVASATGPETAVGEAMRFLAELPWNPDAILNAPDLVWQQRDARSIEVSTPTEGGVARVTLLLDAAGDVVAIRAEDRPRLGDTPAPWIGRFADYVRVGAYRFPSHGEIAWDLPGGEYVYWRGEVLGVTADEAPSQSGAELTPPPH